MGVESFNLGEKEQRDRKRAAGQIRSAREEERLWMSAHPASFISGYERDRGIIEYITTIKGLRHLFEYLEDRQMTSVLDIGSGTGRAIDEISDSRLGRGIKFIKTVLIKHSRSKMKDTRITSAEVLRDIPTSTIGAVISVYGVAYSEAFELVAKQIDRVLMPGGVFKGSFNHNPGRVVVYGSQELKTYEVLRKILVRMGYDTAVDDSILLAIKPGLEDLAGIKARHLLKQDSEGYRLQAYEACGY